jgi:hypothetical protein
LIIDADGNKTFRLAVYNVPVGSKAFVKAYLVWKGTHIRQGFSMIERLLDPGRWPHPDIPAQQMYWILTLACLQFTGDYWIRYICPDYTLEFAESIDAVVQRLFQVCVGADISSWSKCAQERICLPIHLRGCGLWTTEDRRYAKFMEGMIESVLPLIDR